MDWKDKLSLPSSQEKFVIFKDDKPIGIARGMIQAQSWMARGCKAMKYNLAMEFIKTWKSVPESSDTPKILDKDGLPLNSQKSEVEPSAELKSPVVESPDLLLQEKDS